MSEWKPICQPICQPYPKGTRFVFLDSSGGYHVRGFYDQDPANATYWIPLPPPPEPKLTVREALKEAIATLDDAYQSSRACRSIPIEKWWDWSMNASTILPRLRAALESEE